MNDAKGTTTEYTIKTHSTAILVGFICTLVRSIFDS